ncbi:MAG TPA: translation initiation factor [Kofleriaceae bacterium]|nr:translation initiation factor [Kofleriaceae bacterium]
MAGEKPDQKPEKKGLADLAALRDSLPAGTPPAPKPVPEKKGPARAVVRLEKKGRRGKETTIIEKLELKPVELEAWCKDAKSAMGCGGTVEDGAIVLQGDLRKRLEVWLTGRGVRKVTVAG